MELNGNSDANSRNLATPSDATPSDVPLSQAKRGRKTLVENNKRKTLIQELMLKGLKPLEMAQLGVANYKTILNDIRDIQTSWLDLDPEWLNRARLGEWVQYNRALPEEVRDIFIVGVGTRHHHHPTMTTPIDIQENEGK